MSNGKKSVLLLLNAGGRHLEVACCSGFNRGCLRFCCRRDIKVWFTFSFSSHTLHNTYCVPYWAGRQIRNVRFNEAAEMRYLASTLVEGRRMEHSAKQQQRRMAGRRQMCSRVLNAKRAYRGMLCGLFVWLIRYNCHLRFHL